MARAGEHRTRDDGLIVLAPLRGGLGCGTSPPAGRAGGPQFSCVNSCPVNGLPPPGFPGASSFSRVNWCVSLGLRRRRFNVALKRRVSHAGKRISVSAPRLAAADAVAFGEQTCSAGTGHLMRARPRASPPDHAVAACHWLWPRRKSVDPPTRHEHSIPDRFVGRATIHASRQPAGISMHRPGHGGRIFSTVGDISSQCGKKIDEQRQHLGCREPANSQNVIEPRFERIVAFPTLSARWQSLRASVSYRQGDGGVDFRPARIDCVAALGSSRRVAALRPRYARLRP